MIDIKTKRRSEPPRLTFKENIRSVWTDFLALGFWKRIASFIVLIIAVFVVLNFSYFWKNFWFSVFSPRSVATEDLKSDKPNNLIDPNTLIIDSLGIKVPVVLSAEKNEKAFQKALQNGVVHFPDTAKPGEFGNVYIFGHSSDISWSLGKYKTAFALLPRIEHGADIVLSDDRGNPYKYKVIETKVVDAKDLSVLDQRNYEKRLLTLQTSYPIGTALKRYIVVAEIQDPTTTEPLPEVGT